MADMCRVEVMSGAMVLSTTGLARVLQIFALKMDQWLMAVTASIVHEILSKVDRINAHVSLSGCFMVWDAPGS
jgi:hypothetical protein